MAFLEKGSLTIGDALAITKAAAEVKTEVIEDEGEPVDTGRYSLIQNIMDSLAVDAPEHDRP